MSNTNYDLEINLSYSNTYRHYIPTFAVAVPPYNGDRDLFEVYISFDSGSETDITYAYGWHPGGSPPPYYSNEDAYEAGLRSTSIPDAGPFEKAYLRNPYRSQCTFTNANCRVTPRYRTKALFEVQWNSVGFAANENAWFKCSTIQKNTFKQYEWTAATVYYKESTASTYQSVEGVVSGSWSDVTVSTDLTLTDGVVYDIYIKATADDNTKAQTPVAQFTTTDAAAVASCIAPSGTFTTGEVTFVWSHSTAYGTPQYAYDLQYSNNNGSTWTTVANHVVTQSSTDSATITDAGVYVWRVRTYNSNDVVGEWAEATFVNNVPANPPTNLLVNTKGRPTVEWTSVSQSAYQVQFLLNGSVVYDSGAVYTPETSHFVNKYFNDNRSYIVRLRIYNALGEISSWVETGYQQIEVDDVVFDITEAEGGGATITVTSNDVFSHYYLLRNDIPIAEIIDGEYIDRCAVGLTNYSVVGVTSEDQSDIQTKGYRVSYPHATLVAQNGQAFKINKRVDSAYEIQTSNEAQIAKESFIGENYPAHYPSKMRLKSFIVSCFDEQGIMDDLVGTLVFYADNFGNGGYCIVTNYDKTDNYVKNSQGIYANETSLTLEVTSYDDSIEYPL